MTKELQDAIRHMKTRCDAWAVKEIEDALDIDELHYCFWCGADMRGNTE